MIDTYPNAEQTWFIRDLFYRSQLPGFQPTESEAKLLETLPPLLREVERKCEEIVQDVEEALDSEIIQKLRDELDPFQRKEALFLGAGHFSEYGGNRLHERLADALSLVGGLQQGGLQGTEPDSAEVIAEAQKELQGFLLNLAEKLGVTGMTFENSSK